MSYKKEKKGAIQLPPKSKITKEHIRKIAFDLVRENGITALNARTVAKELGCSTQPIFSNYASMEELKSEVIQRADRLYKEYLQREVTSGKFPEYKASGMAYIRFAKEEKELFKLLFMRDRTEEKIPPSSPELENLAEMIQSKEGISHDEAFLFHLEMWVYVHGIATMIATSYLEWDWDLISRVLSDAYLGMAKKYKETEQ